MNQFSNFIRSFGLMYKSRDHIRQYQLEKLQQVVSHAHKNVPFYQQKYQGLDLTLSSLEDIRKLPVVSSQELRECSIDGITSKAATEGQLMKMATTGTSGSPLKFKISQKENTQRQLSLIRFMIGYGWLPWWKGVNVWRTVAPKKYSIFQRLINARKFHVDIDQPIEAQVKQIKAVRPQFMYGMLSSLEQIADWLIEHDEHLPGLSFFTTGGEVKMPHHSEKFRKAFGTPGLQRYGAVECGLMGYSCIHCGELCFDENSFFVEVVGDAYEPVKNGGYGKVLFTALNQFTTPLVRYELGDLVTLSGPQSRCKNKFLHFKSIDGRDFDVLPLKDGRKLHSQSLTNIGTSIPGLKKMQLILKKDQSLVVKYIVEDGISDEAVRKEVIEKLHFEALEVNFEKCTVIPNEASGKFKFLKKE